MNGQLWKRLAVELYRENIAGADTMSDEEIETHLQQTRLIEYQDADNKGSTAIKCYVYQDLVRDSITVRTWDGFGFRDEKRIATFTLHLPAGNINTVLPDVVAGPVAPIPQAPPETLLCNLGFPLRSRRVISRMGLRTVADIATVSVNEFLSQKGVGDTSLWETRKILNSIGWDFRQDSSENQQAAGGEE